MVGTPAGVRTWSIISSRASSLAKEDRTANFRADGVAVDRRRRGCSPRSLSLMPKAVGSTLEVLVSL